MAKRLIRATVLFTTAPGASVPGTALICPAEAVLCPSKSIVNQH